MITPLPTPTPYVPDADFSRIEWGAFGTYSEQTFTWFVNLFKYISDFLFSVPITSDFGLFKGATFGGAICYFILLYALFKFFFKGYFSAGFNYSSSDFGGKK